MSLPPPSLGGGVGVESLPSFGNTLGALLIGGLVAVALWGVICSQTYTYFMYKSARDRPIMKGTILALWLLNTFDSALDFHILYYYMVTNYLNVRALETIVWSLIIHVAATSLSNFIIRAMFIYKIYQFSKKNLWLTGLLIILSFVDLIVGLYISVKAFGLTSFANLGGFSKIMYLDFASGTVSDLGVSMTLCALLYRSRTGFRRTDSLIRTLMLYTVNTGAIVAITATIGLIFYTALPHTLIFIATWLCLSKLYVSSYFATLNARAELREKISDSLSIHLSELSQYPRNESERSISVAGDGKTGREGLAISVKTLVNQKVEEGGDELLTASTRTGSGRAF